MLVVINFTNFEVVEDQFNVLGGDYLTGAEIMQALQDDVTEQLAKNNIDPKPLIPVERNNEESAWALFQLGEFKADWGAGEFEFTFTYTGTAK